MNQHWYDEKPPLDERYSDGKNAVWVGDFRRERSKRGWGLIFWTLLAVGVMCLSLFGCLGCSDASNAQSAWDKAAHKVGSGTASKNADLKAMGY